jgi:RND family efflux transporter MFP subunit
MTVTTVRATAGDIAQTFEVGGVVRARLTATIASRVTAPIEAFYVTSGARVKRGTPLVALESRALDADVERSRAAATGAVEAVDAAAADVRAAESSLTLARATHDRVRSLFDKRSATAQEWDEALARLQGAEAQAAAARARAAAARSARDAAEAALRGAETARSYASITAPFDGVVAERLVDPGAMANAGATLLVVEDASVLRLHVLVDESRARGISPGSDADVRLDQDAAWTRGHVAEVGRLDAASHTFLVKLDGPGIQAARSGWFGRARFPIGTRRALTVPATSLVRRGQLVFVYLATPENIVRLRAVVAGEAIGNRVEILAGLTEGDLIVTAVLPGLTDGAAIAGGRR